MCDDVLIRDLETPVDPESVRGLVSSLLVAELIAPSSRFWLMSAWVSDIAILDNRNRQYRVFAPQWSAREIPLSDVLCAIVERGGKVVVIVRDEPHNESFIAKMRDSFEKSASLDVIVAQNFHQKGMVGDDFVLEGSMNFTYYGFTLNDEHLVLRRARAGRTGTPKDSGRKVGPLPNTRLRMAVRSAAEFKQLTAYDEWRASEVAAIPAGPRLTRGGL